LSSDSVLIVGQLDVVDTELLLLLLDLSQLVPVLIQFEVAFFNQVVEFSLLALVLLLTLLEFLMAELELLVRFEQILLLDIQLIVVVLLLLELLNLVLKLVLQFLNFCISLGSFFLRLLLFLVVQLLVSLLFDLLFFEFLDLMLLLLSFLFLSDKIVIVLSNLLAESGLGKFKVVDLCLLGVDLFLELFESGDELADLIVVTKGKTTTIFDNLVKLGNLILQTLDNFSGLFFLFFGSFDKLPAFLDFSSQNSDGI